MKKLILILIIVMAFTAGMGITQNAYADTGLTNITVNTYPAIGSISAIPATFQTLMNNNIMPLEKTILPFSFLIFLFGIALRLYMNEEKGYFKEIVYMIFILAVLIMYNEIFLWLNAVINGIATGILPQSELTSMFHNLFTYKHPGINIVYDFSVGAIYAAVFSVIAGVAVWIMEWLRYVLLCFMYLVGPLTISLSLIQPLRPFLKAWIKDTIEVMSWIIVTALLFQIFNTILLVQNDYASLQNMDPLAVGSIFAMLLIFMILTPYLTSKLYQGGMGALGSIASYATISLISGGASAGLGAAGISGGGLAGSLGANLAGKGTTTAARHAAESAGGYSSAQIRAAANARSRKNPYQKRGSNEE
jgi:hypothetical protein